VQEILIGALQIIAVGAGRMITVGAEQHTHVGHDFKVIAGADIVLQTGDAKIIMKHSGEIEISGTAIKIAGATIDTIATGIQTIKGSMVKINT